MYICTYTVMTMAQAPESAAVSYADQRVRLGTTAPKGAPGSSSAARAGVGTGDCIYIYLCVGVCGCPWRRRRPPASPGVYGV